MRDYFDQTPPVKQAMSCIVRIADSGTESRAFHTDGTDYSVRILYWECRGGRYYTGNIGTASRHETRRFGQDVTRD